MPIVLAGVAFAAVLAGLTLLNGLIIMILWGAIAGTLGFTTIGYGTAILISLALGVVGSFFRSTAS